jgi:metal-responsive CopG/Arc/MetJ family transcriptional regulator
VRVTVRLPDDVAYALDHLSNRSEFVRDAILARLATLCPQCQGTGFIAPTEKQSHSPIG